jgi:hypothetical protein
MSARTCLTTDGQAGRILGAQAGERAAEGGTQSPPVG